MLHSKPALVVTLCALALGCKERVPDLDITVQRVQAGYGHGEQTWLSMYLLATDADGNALECGDGEVEVEVAVSFDGGVSWADVDGAVIHCVDDWQGDVALVMDNSGSESGYLEQLNAGASAMADGVFDAGGRASLVRVSTDSEVMVDLTDDATALESGLDSMFLTNGWTALYDGIRMGNETLGGALLSRDEVPEYDGIDDFCSDAGQLGVVAFTDGQENNSSGEQEYDHLAYPGDGLDTTLADLYNLRVGGVTTPIYTIGLGGDVDHDGLEELATWTGGRHRAIEFEHQLPDVFSVISDYFTSTTQVCAEVGEVGCGQAQVAVDWSWTTEDGVVYEGSDTYKITVDCPIDYTGRVVTILLTLSDEDIDSAVATDLAAGAVDWVTSKASPSVLIVLDDNHHGEDVGDADYVADLLEAEGYAVDRMDEPADGLVAADVSGYDVVWFCNPGYPPDDAASIEVLEAFLADGGGVVLQGDDMSRGYASAFSMEALTMLEYHDNGTEFCGEVTDNHRGSEYRVDVDALGHPVTSGVEGESFTYGNDIDNTSPLDGGEDILSWATLDGSTSCDNVPVIVAYEP